MTGDDEDWRKRNWIEDLGRLLTEMRTKEEG